MTSSFLLTFFNKYLLQPYLEQKKIPNPKPNKQTKPQNKMKKNHPKNPPKTTTTTTNKKIANPITTLRKIKKKKGKISSPEYFVLFGPEFPAKGMFFVKFGLLNA